MRILLVFPRFRYPSGDPPLGVAYLAAVLRRDGVEVEIFDATFVKHPLSVLSDKLQAAHYDAVGISALTSMIAAAGDIAALVKQVSPETLVILGGPHATILPEETLALPGVDVVAIGEAEESFRRLVAADLDFSAVSGFYYWSESSRQECRSYRQEDRSRQECRSYGIGNGQGQIVDSGPAPLVEDLDTIPYPAWDLLPMEQYLRVWYQLDAVGYGLRGTSIFASRGCPYDCAYCQPTLRRIFGRRIRHRSVDNIVAELAELRERFAIGGVMWLDDTFGTDHRWLMELCCALIESELDIVWGCNLRADLVERETLAMMQEAGLRIVHLGIESATQRILDEVYQKGTTIEQAREAVHVAKDLGLRVRGYFMLGAPTETEQEVRASLRLANQLPLDDVTFSITTPLPGTHLYEKTRDMIGRDLSEFDYYKSAVYDSRAVLPGSRLDRLKKLGYIQFYLGRKRLGRTIRSVLGVSGLRKALLKIRRF